MIGRQQEKLERLYLTYLDKLSISKTMRQNLASDIIAGYHLANVCKQMIAIEDYEKGVVEVAKKAYEDYAKSVNADSKTICLLERKHSFVWVTV